MTPPDHLLPGMRLVLVGGGSQAERFAWAWLRRPAGLESRRALAKAIGVHPSALSPSNFKLPPGPQAQTEYLLQVPRGFLGMTPPPALVLPEDLVLLGGLFQLLRETCLAIQEAERPAWSIAQAVLVVDPEIVIAHLAGRVDPAIARLALGELRDHARRELERPVVITTTLGELTLAVDALVEVSLSRDAGTLRGERLRQARKWHALTRITDPLPPLPGDDPEPAP